jgi:hypothetical protein
VSRSAKGPAAGPFSRHAPIESPFWHAGLWPRPAAVSSAAPLPIATSCEAHAVARARAPQLEPRCPLINSTRRPRPGRHSFPSR